jgi:hypothetical protein
MPQHQSGTPNHGPHCLQQDSSKHVAGKVAGMDGAAPPINDAKRESQVKLLAGYDKNLWMVLPFQMMVDATNDGGCNK